MPKEHPFDRFHTYTTAATAASIARGARVARCSREATPAKVRKLERILKEIENLAGLDAIGWHTSTPIDEWTCDCLELLGYDVRDATKDYKLTGISWCGK